MRAIFATAVALLVALVPAAMTRASATSTEVSAGISFLLPHGWRLLNGDVIATVDPVLRLAATNAKSWRAQPGSRAPNRAVLVLVAESVNGTTGFGKRPRHFKDKGAKDMLGGCGLPSGPGYAFAFRDANRRFYAWVYVRPRADAGGEKDAFALLNSLLITDRRLAP